MPGYHGRLVPSECIALFTDHVHTFRLMLDSHTCVFLNVLFMVTWCDNWTNLSGQALLLSVGFRSRSCNQSMLGLPPLRLLNVLFMVLWCDHWTNLSGQAPLGLVGFWPSSRDRRMLVHAHILRKCCSWSEVVTTTTPCVWSITFFLVPLAFDHGHATSRCISSHASSGCAVHDRWTYDDVRAFPTWYCYRRPSGGWRLGVGFCGFLLASSSVSTLTTISRRALLRSQSSSHGHSTGRWKF